MRSSYEQPPWELRDSRRLFSLRCRGQARWDEILDAYGPLHNTEFFVPGGGAGDVVLVHRRSVVTAQAIGSVWLRSDDNKA